VALTAGKRATIVEAATGRVLGVRQAKEPGPRAGKPAPLDIELHHYLLAGDRGELVLGASAPCCSPALPGLGLWIAVPCAGCSGRIAGARLPQKLWGWHRMSGVLAAAALLPLALTGAYLVWGKEIRTFAAAHVRDDLPPEAKTRLAAGRLWAGCRVGAGAGRVPGRTLVSVALPGAKAGEYRFRMRQPDEMRAICSG
jgi:uncharacterized iron-regulated membrane protein